ncbi:MerR family transcriptional regulator [Radiobacillus sp. PE A8.2]|uniref:MerR family transcriptional regulator n=1 Tax=Radiobacillus sp. PE A8.2 TaxID=3380349 RepID=UPI00388F40AA
MFGIKKVSEITGISPITLRAWENRYEVIKPLRTDGGTRMYTQEHVDDLLWVINEKETNKISVKQAMKLLQERKHKLDATHIVTQEVIADYNQFIDNIYKALVQYDTTKATHLTNLAFSTFDYEDVFHHIFAPILYIVGDNWKSGELSVAQEHFISHYLQRRLFHFFQEISGDSNKPKALAICPPNELHNIGLILFSLFLKRRGTDVLFIGENTPKENVLPVIHANNVRLICFSVTIDDHVKHLQDFIAYLDDYSLDVHYVIGGAAAKQIPDQLQKFVLSGGVEEWGSWLNKIKL